MQAQTAAGGIRAALGIIAALALVVAWAAFAISRATGSPVAAQYQYGDGPATTMLVGSGKVAFADFPQPGRTTVEQFQVSARDGPGAQGPRGTIVFHSPFAAGPQRLDVTCLVVTGELAVAGGEFREPFAYGGARIRWANIVVQDNGPPGHGVRDLANAVAFIDRPRAPGFSPCDVVPPPIHRVEQGNFVVSGGRERG